jgi:hypothetical protein
MIRGVAIACLLAFCGCTNHTAAIAHSAIDARQAVGAAIIHMDAAREQLEGIQVSIDAIQEHTSWVSDDQNPVFETLRYVSVAGMVVGAVALVYTLKNWIPVK